MKHFCIYEVNTETRSYKYVDEYGENKGVADEICDTLNNYRRPEWPIYFCVRCLEQKDFDNILNYKPFIETIILKK